MDELIRYCELGIEYGVRPEWEVWHSGSIWNLNYLMARHRRHVHDDPAALALHQRDHVLAPEPYTAEIDLDETFELFPGHVGHGLDDDNPGHVDQHVHSSEVLLELLDGSDDTLLRGDITMFHLVEPRGTARAKLSLQHVVAASYPALVLRESLGDRRTDTARRSGDSRYRLLTIHHGYAFASMFKISRAWAGVATLRPTDSASWTTSATSSLADAGSPYRLRA